MTLKDARETLLCRKTDYLLRQFYNGSMYRSDGGRTVAVDAWVLNATFSGPGFAEEMELTATGNPDNPQVIRISHIVSRGTTVETMPMPQKVSSDMQARYGAMLGGGTRLYSLQTPDGAALDQNSPVGVLCNSPTEPRCGRKVVLAMMPTYAQTVPRYELVLENGAIAAPILAKARSRQQN